MTKQLSLADESTSEVTVVLTTPLTCWMMQANLTRTPREMAWMVLRRRMWPPRVETAAYEHWGFAVLLADPSRRPGDSLIAESRQTTALGVFERCPVPVVAVADDGTVLFANTAFVHFFDYSCDAPTCMSYEAIRSVLPADETLFVVTRLGSNAIKSLMLSGQATVFVKMRKLATLSAADPDAIAMFEELVEHLSR